MKSVKLVCLSFDLLFNLLRLALWSFVGKEVSPWLFTCAVFFSAVLTVDVPFLFGVYILLAR